MTENTGSASDQFGVRQLLAYQLDMLKVEIEMINKIIERMDGITQATKNWAVVTWAGSVALTLRERDLHPFLILTATLPMLFWYIDAVWRRLQARSTFRMLKIREFLNGGALARSFEAGHLHEFIVMDPVGTQYKGSKDYLQHVSMRRTLRYKEVAIFYVGPILISILLWVVFVFLLR